MTPASASPRRKSRPIEPIGVLMRWYAVALFVACAAVRAMGAQSAPVPELTAEQIVQKNVDARGGLEAWRKIQTMVWVGHMERAGGPMASMSFVLQQKRPNKT